MNEQEHILTAGRGHGGNVHLLTRLAGEQRRILDFSANINPLGPPAWLRARINRALDQIAHYPDPDCHFFGQAIASHYGLEQDTIVAGNGTTELLYALPHALSFKRALIPVPSYIDYQKVMARSGIETAAFPLAEENDFALDLDAFSAAIRKDDLVLLGTPNNPTGTMIGRSDIIALATAFPSAWFVIDEAFLDFVPGAASTAAAAANIITLNSLTKFYALPGLRLGFGTFPRQVAARVREFLPPWTVNTLAQEVGRTLFDDREYRRRTLDLLEQVKDRFLNGLAAIPTLKVYPSAANYVLLRLSNGGSAVGLAGKLLESGIAIRPCSNYLGLDSRYFRVAVRSAEENDTLLEALAAALDVPSPRPGRKQRRTGSLMIQGTSSNAGKSVLVAALCRILMQDGVQVAPFKAQNMSLNSFVTRQGLEMGRAQVVQAQAARLDPDVRMNPVLLKPNSDVGSQVIIKGRPVGNMTVRQYVAYKDEAAAQARACFDSLAAEYQAVILEGAGSPGEVNLKSHDIVNMQMARYARSPVLLVGDIDRGGVYASFIGTMDVLEEWERNLVAGFLVNRFRGDQSLLAPAHEYLEEYTGKPVLGTIPYVPDLGLPEEDSVSFKAGGLQRRRPAGEHVEIALINLPHISNFTDIEPFLDEPDVYLNIIDAPEELKGPAAVIIPGSKNVMGDLNFLADSGLGPAIAHLAREGCEVVGICGGYQILGTTVADPHGIESDGESRPGLGLLDIATSLAPDKTLSRREGRHIASGHTVFGYEIHHGISTGAVEPLLRFGDGSTCGTRHGRLPVWGAYLHGIFDADSFRRWFIDALREKAGLTRLEKVVAPYDLEAAFDNLADIVREATDMQAIYRHLGL